MARLFFAVSIPGAVQREIRSAVAPILPGAHFRTVTADNLHITLAFVGEVPPDTVSEAQQLLSSPFPVRTPSPEIELEGVGSFPRESDPRVVWIGVRSGFEQLQSIHQQLLHRLAIADIPVDHKPFRAHLTVGYRRRSTPRGTAREAVNALRGELGTCRWTVPLQHISLYESTLAATGAVHRTLRSGPVLPSEPL